MPPKDPTRSGQKTGAKGCPICGRPPETRYRPFCSRRCADIDLGRWMTGAYAIPVTEADDEDGDTIPTAPVPGPDAGPER